MFDPPTIPNPDLNTSEILPTAWQTFAEQHIPEPEIWPLWRRFKNVSGWPFSRKAWTAYVDAVAKNRKERMEQRHA